MVSSFCRARCKAPPRRWASASLEARAACAAARAVAAGSDRSCTAGSSNSSTNAPSSSTPSAQRLSKVSCRDSSQGRGSTLLCQQCKAHCFEGATNEHLSHCTSCCEQAPVTSSALLSSQPYQVKKTPPALQRPGSVIAAPRSPKREGVQSKARCKGAHGWRESMYSTYAPCEPAIAPLQPDSTPATGPACSRLGMAVCPLYGALGHCLQQQDMHGSHG